MKYLISSGNRPLSIYDSLDSAIRGCQDYKFAPNLILYEIGNPISIQCLNNKILMS